MTRVAGIACFLAWVFAGFPWPGRDEDGPRHVSRPTVWEALSDEVPGAVPFVGARVGDMVYVGRLLSIDFQADAGSYVALAKPITTSRAGARGTPMEAEWQRLLLPLSEVREITVRWVERSSL